MKIFFTSDTHFGHKNILKYNSNRLAWLPKNPMDRDLMRAWSDPTAKLPPELYRYWKSRTNEMNDVMVERWNSRVGKSDVVYHLGDFFLGLGKDAALSTLYRLNGNIRFVPGNHDEMILRKDFSIREMFNGMFEWVRPLNEEKLDGHSIIMCHFPIKSWHKMHRGSIHLHGHCHGSLEFEDIKRLDVGVDTHHGFPYSLEDIVFLASRLGVKSYDHHAK